jgi:Zn finger protein HypA/HybF involved in hydrogenase expression
MRILVIGPEFMEVEKYLKKIVCVDGKAIITTHKKDQVQKVIDEIGNYCGDVSYYNFKISKKHPKRITISYKSSDEIEEIEENVPAFHWCPTCGVGLVPIEDNDCPDCRGEMKEVD